MIKTITKSVTIDKTVSVDVDVDINEEVSIDVDIDLDDFAKPLDNSTIRYISENFEDTELMETIEKLFTHKTITKRQIITHLENLLNGVQ